MTRQRMLGNFIVVTLGASIVGVVGAVVTLALVATMNGLIVEGLARSLGFAATLGGIWGLLAGLPSGVLSSVALVLFQRRSLAFQRIAYAGFGAAGSIPASVFFVAGILALSPPLVASLGFILTGVLLAFVAFPLLASDLRQPASGRKTDDSDDGAG